MGIQRLPEMLLVNVATGKDMAATFFFSFFWITSVRTVQERAFFKDYLILKYFHSFFSNTCRYFKNSQIRLSCFIEKNNLRAVFAFKKYLMAIIEPCFMTTLLTFFLNSIFVFWWLLNMLFQLLLASSVSLLGM